MSKKNQQNNIQVKNSKVPIIISCVALLISAISVLLDIHQNEMVNQYSYQIDAQTSRPLLKPIKDVEFRYVNIERKPLEDSLFDYDPRIPAVLGDPTPPIKDLTQIKIGKIEGYLKFINQSGNIASLKNYVYLIDSTTVEIIREWLFENKYENIKPQRDSGIFIFETIDIAPGDTFILPFSYDWTARELFQGSQCTMHFTLFYENQFGALFDTYFWIRLRQVMKFPECLALLDSTSDISQVYAFMPLDYNESYRMYKPKEKQLYERTIKQIQGEK